MKSFFTFKGYFYVVFVDYLSMSSVRFFPGGILVFLSSLFKISLQFEDLLSVICKFFPVCHLLFN